jgi:hypothetical protein
MTHDVLVQSKSLDCWEVYIYPRGWRRWLLGSKRLLGTYSTDSAAWQAAAALNQTPVEPKVVLSAPAKSTVEPLGQLYVGPNGSIRTTPYVPPVVALTQVDYHCPVHGNIGRQIVQSNIQGAAGTWCMVCIVEKLDELGVRRTSR